MDTKKGELTINCEGDQLHGATATRPRLRETGSHWICCEGREERDDQKDTKFEGQLVPISHL